MFACRVLYNAPRLLNFHAGDLQVDRPAADAGAGAAPGGLVRVVVHCDMDCFFASVAQVTDPLLRGKPVVVCHSSVQSAAASSDVASASYEARKFGIRNGMTLNKVRTIVLYVG